MDGTNEVEVGIALGNLKGMKTGRSQRLLILTYHRVPATRDSLIDDPIYSETFRLQMSCLARYFNVLPLSVAARLLASRSLPKRAVSITFDDGYRDNFEVALPILQQFGLRATFFVTTGFLGNGRMWNDTVIEGLRLLNQRAIDLDGIGLGEWGTETVDEKRVAMLGILNALKYKPVAERNAAVESFSKLVPSNLPRNLMMHVEHVRALSDAGMDVGAHTVNHPILTRLDDDLAEIEIRRNKTELENITQSDVSSFAYPNGRPDLDYNSRHVQMVQSLGFDCAVSTSEGLATTGSDPYQLPRMAPWQDRSWKFSATYLSKFFQRIGG